MSNKIISKTTSAVFERIEREDGSWEEWESYANGRTKSYRTSSGTEQRFDEEGNLVYDYSESLGATEYKYNSEGTIIYMKDGELEEWYDDQSRTIHQKDPDYEEWCDYKEDNSCIRHYKDAESEIWEEFDKDGIHLRTRYDYNGIKTVIEHRGEGKIMVKVYPNGNTTVTEYDEKGHPTHIKESSGYEEWRKYNYREDGHDVMTKNNLGMEELIRYHKDAPMEYVANLPITFK